MKYFKFAVLLTVVALVVSCFSAPNAHQGPQSYGSDLTASQGESEIILNSSSNAGTLSVYVDGQLKQTMTPQDNVKLIVPDGRHTLVVDWVGKDRNGANVPLKGDPLDLTVKSEQYVYNISLPELLAGSSTLLVGKKVQLDRVSVNVLSGRAATRDSIGIEGAVIRVCEAMIPELPRGAAIAVLDISSLDREAAESAVAELEYQLGKSRLFKIVERKNLDSIRSEQEIGDVSEESAASMGHILGADIVITGSASGSGTNRRLTLKALNTTTAEVVSMPPREPF
jgi:hypothetical protein